MLGTSSQVPTKERNVTGLFLRMNSKGILIDCGEGTQRQMNIAGIKRTDISMILITHWHGDHVGGLTSLIETIGNDLDYKSMKIYGPKGSREFFEHMKLSRAYNSPVELEIIEIDAPEVKTIFENDEFIIQAANLDHSTPVIGYSFIEKDKRRINTDYIKSLGLSDGPYMKDLQDGKSTIYNRTEIDVEKATYIVPGRKFTFETDTALCTNCVELAHDSDLLITECTYHSNLQEKAEQYKHLTSKDATEIANQSNSKKLVLTHFSQRYKTVDEIEEDAKTYFENTQCAYDFMKIKVEKM